MKTKRKHDGSALLIVVFLASLMSVLVVGIPGRSYTITVTVATGAVKCAES